MGPKFGQVSCMAGRTCRSPDQNDRHSCRPCELQAGRHADFARVHAQKHNGSRAPHATAAAPAITWSLRQDQAAAAALAPAAAAARARPGAQTP